MNHALKAGFGKTDITPRAGVELCGFGPYLNRHSNRVRDRLWARAMAVSDEDTTAILVSCDLVGVDSKITREVRTDVAEAVGVPPECVMVHCTHTHSGPATIPILGWGDPDAPYLELLPGRIARACIEAVGRLDDARFGHAEVPCPGIGYNREHEQRPTLAQALDPEWRPRKPELTDTSCHVLTACAERTGDLIGFLSYFGCHPVVCCASTRAIHGDYAGVATHLLEEEFPGSVGLFLQGAQGDVNTCVVHHPEEESMRALNVIAKRYASRVREGIGKAEPLQARPLVCGLRARTFSRQRVTLGELRTLLEGHERTILRPGAADGDRHVRMATVYARALRGLIARVEAGGTLENPAELQGIRLGAVALLGAPFEIFQRIRNDVVQRARAEIPLVMGLTNDCLGYAPDRESAAAKGYAAGQVPFMLGELPFADIAGELTEELLRLDRDLQGRTAPDSCTRRKWS